MNPMNQSNPHDWRDAITALFLLVIGLSVAMGTAPLWEPMAQRWLAQQFDSEPTQ